MKPLDAEKLLGGHATGTLTGEERSALFAAALDHQEVFDALMDEEALRELLADPVLKAQLLAALAPATAPKVVPFWRRTGVLGAAAGLLMAATAGLVVLRSPEKTPPPLERATPKAPEAKAVEDKPVAPRLDAPARKNVPAPAVALPPPAPAFAVPAPPPPAPPSRRLEAALATAPASGEAEAHRADAEADQLRAEAQDKVAKKAKAPRSSTALLEVAGAAKEESLLGRTTPRNQAADHAPGGTRGGATGAVATQAPSTEPARKAQVDAVPAPAAPAAKSAKRPEWKAAAAFAPGWKLEPQADGSTRVLVKGPVGAQAVVLRRGAAGVQVLALRLIDPGGDMAWWQGETRLLEGDVLDLYFLNAPVPEPAKLPATGPVDGYRVRIHPAGKN